MTITTPDNDGVISLLLLLCRTGFDDAERHHTATEVRAMKEWSRFTDLAVRHGVAALVWQSLTDLSLAKLVPETERTILEGSHLRSLARVAYLTSVAAEVAGSLEKEGIRVVLLKGLALEHQLYGAKGLRQMSDADLLVSPENALMARDILIKAGFVSNSLKSCLYKPIILDIGNHLPELHRGGISVDLHHRLFGRKGTEMVATAMDRAELISAGGRTLFVLPPQTAFLALVSHIWKHENKGEFQLRLYIDIYLLLLKYGSEILSEPLPAAAGEAGIEKETREILTLMEKVWGLTVPMESLPDVTATEEMSPEQSQKLVERFLEKVRKPWSVPPISQREFFLRNLRSLESRWKRFIFIAGDMFPSLEFMKQRYGCRTALKALLFYPHRLGKLLWILGLKRGGYQND